MMKSIAEVLHEEGASKGRPEGRREGQLAAYQTLLRQLLLHRFGPLPVALMDHIAELSDVEHAQACVEQAYRAQDLESVRFERPSSSLSRDTGGIRIRWPSIPAAAEASAEVLLACLKNVVSPKMFANIRRISRGVMYEQLAEGVERGRANGRVEGQLLAYRDTLRRLLTWRFGDLPRPLLQRIEVVSDFEHLQVLFHQSLFVQRLHDLKL